MTGATESGDDAARATAGGVSAGGEASGAERPGAVAAGAAEAGDAGGDDSAARSESGSGVNTGIPALDSAIAVLPIDDRIIEEKPEILVGGAFVAGFLVARILKAIGRG